MNTHGRSVLKQKRKNKSKGRSKHCQRKSKRESGNKRNLDQRKVIDIVKCLILLLYHVLIVTILLSLFISIMRPMSPFPSTSIMESPIFLQMDPVRNGDTCFLVL